MKKFSEIVIILAIIFITVAHLTIAQQIRYKPNSPDCYIMDCDWQAEEACDDICTWYDEGCDFVLWGASVCLNAPECGGTNTKCRHTYRLYCWDHNYWIWYCEECWICNPW